MKRYYYIVELKNGNKFMVYTTYQWSDDFVLEVMWAMLGYNTEDVKSLTATNKVKDIVAFHKNSINLDERYESARKF